MCGCSIRFMRLCVCACIAPLDSKALWTANVSRSAIKELFDDPGLGADGDDKGCNSGESEGDVRSSVV